MDALERQVGKAGIMPSLWRTCLEVTPRQARVEYLDFAKEFTAAVDRVRPPLAVGYDTVFVGANVNSISTFIPSFHVNS